MSSIIKIPKDISENWEIITSIVVIIFSAGVAWSSASKVWTIEEKVNTISNDVSEIKGYLKAKSEGE